MNWEHMISFLLGVIIALVAYRLGRYNMGQAGKEFFTRLVETLDGSEDKAIRETLEIILKFYKQWNHLRRWL